MCFSTDNGAAQAANQQTAMLEAQQAKHDANVATGKTAIDSAFSQFTPQYFDKYGQSYQNTLQPELTDQYGINNDKMTAMLADNGQLGGSVGNNDLAQLLKNYNFGQSDIANQAANAENQFKASVDNAKTNLYSLNTQAADPSTMATQAQATAGSIVAPQSFPTLSDYFGNVLGSVAQASKINQSSANPVSTTQLSNFFAPVG